MICCAWYIYGYGSDFAINSFSVGFLAHTRRLNLLADGTAREKTIGKESLPIVPAMCVWIFQFHTPFGQINLDLILCPRHRLPKVGKQPNELFEALIFSQDKFMGLVNTVSNNPWCLL
jgi:hypothetical protein